MREQSLQPGLRITRVQAWVIRAPIDRPVVTSFGVMHDRPALLLALTDADGAVGYGEVWCNFPSVGAEHRARLITHTFAPLVAAKPWLHPAEMFAHLTETTHVLALQSGEAGPFAQCIAGLDIALWDLWARKQNRPVWQLLGGAPRVRTYASGLSASDQPALALSMQAQGHVAFKLKVGFGALRDQQALSELRSALGESARLMVDANQAWDLDAAQAQLPGLAQFNPLWIEEPLRCDAPWAQWQSLASNIATPIAAGENLRGSQFDDALQHGALQVLQPDIGKWGGFTGCLALARKAIDRGLQLCPHWLGGGVGLTASFHLLSAANADARNHGARVEWDANPNPLRLSMAGHLPEVKDGWIALSDAPGLGVAPQWDALPITQTLHWTARS